MKTADSMEKSYGIKINMDHLLAGALLHDIMKMFEWKAGEEGAEPTGVLLDHSMLAVAEFYYRGFPEDVIHIIASHFGESGPTPPRNYEALILHYVDTLLSLMSQRCIKPSNNTIPQWSSMPVASLASPM
jgi:7,8-dihydroneopterin 2',3'-cyclic phosphate phosphodiesterase